ncbi:MAG: PAS domain S-box protein, partial [Motiliproteus sp.]|nr:PAS domain S-box protein [Motiliproteus sp.]
MDGVYPEDVDKLLEAQKSKLEGLQDSDTEALISALLIAAVLSLMLALWFSKGLERLFRIYQTEIKQKQQKLSDNAKQLQVAACVFENSSEGIMVTDPQYRLLAVNDAFTTITGYSEREVLGKKPTFMKSGRHDEAYYKEMWRSLDEEGVWRGEIWNRRK